MTHTPQKILRSLAKCLDCNDIVESKHRHDFVRCKCGKMFLDGGKDYVRYGGNLDHIQLLTEYEEKSEEAKA